ncbi:MAG: sulfotransferase family protein [Rhodobacteraceae bacterium]|nr:sulfotransferase family protein [Paracoccaceae bacterium]
MTSKIFCIGFQKTGTSSLGNALHALGFSVGVSTKVLNRRMNWRAPDPRPKIIEKVLAVVDGVDAIQDSPNAFIYRELDAAHPGAKFILTIRDTADWLESYRRFFPDQNNPLRSWMYGVERLSGNEALYCKKYDAQNAEIVEYFADRPDDLLVMDLSKGDGWLDLVNFLGKDVLKPFPHANKNKR